MADSPLPAPRAGRFEPAPLSIGARDRAAAWIVTGPLGHLYGTLVDVLLLWTRYLAARVRGASTRPYS